jgi:hypothetical protein
MTPENATIKSLFPNLTEQEAKAAEEHFRAYLEIVVRIYNRVRQNPELHAELRKALRSERPF